MLIILHGSVGVASWRETTRQLLDKNADIRETCHNRVRGASAVDYRDNVTDELIRRAIGDGTNLPNAGKKLVLDDPYTPDDLQLAHKILKDNNFVPSWIADSKDLDHARDALLAKIRTSQIAQRLTDEIAAFNKRVLSYNLKAPQGVQHKRMIDLERERRRFTSG
jgi:hypothetical protein